MANNDYQFVKTVNINDLPAAAWQYIQGGPVAGSDLETYYQQIPWLFRAVDIRANSVASMPFSIYRKDKTVDEKGNETREEVDTSGDYNNEVGFLPHPSALFGIIEAALTMWGYAYCFKLKNAYIDTGLRYILPTTIRPDVDKETGAVKFVRTVNGEPKEYTDKDIVYFWKPDPHVEKGPPKSSPAMTAANACGVLLNLDEFVKAFWKNGAVKTTILFTDTNDPTEKSRLKTLWGRISSGIRSAWGSHIFSGKSVTPVVIGEGLESLQDNDLTESKRIDIAAALGIPYSVLFSNASNRATAEQDDLHLYTKTIIPECEFIEEVLNEQVFEPAGYTLSFTPENLDVMQVDENERAASLGSLITALQSPEEFNIAASILGYEIDPEVQKKIDELIANKEKAREEMANKFDEAQNNLPDEQQPQDDEKPAGNIPPQFARSKALEIWKAKSVKRVKAGRKASCPFNDPNLDPVTIAAVSGALEGAETVTDVEMIFSDTFAGYP